MKKLIHLTLTLALVSFSQLFAEEPIPERGGEGTVTLDIKPAGSIVYLGGEEIGKTPIKNLKFRSGRHDLTVMDQGQELIATRFNVFPNKENVYEAKTTMPFGVVEVTTVPSSCEVHVDGEHASGTAGAALKIGRLDVGDHFIEVKCGRRKLSSIVTVEGEKTTKVKFNTKTKKILINGKAAKK